MRISDGNLSKVLVDVSGRGCFLWVFGSQVPREARRLGDWAGIG